MIMIVIMKYTIALLLLVNPCILHLNNRTACPAYVIIAWKEDASLPAMFNLLCSSTNQQLFTKNFCNQSSHYENYGRFNGSHHVPTTESTLFVVNKDEWYTKEGCAKSMKNALYACTVIWQKVPLGLKWRRTVKKIRSVALAIVELRESEGIRLVS